MSVPTSPVAPEYAGPMEPPRHGQPIGRAGWWLVIGVCAFAATVLVRLVPVLRGGGLAGYGPYDESVYYASAVGLVHGVLPYRDFLLLQPPGIVVALTPFAMLGRLIGEANGLALARFAWMTMGGLTAVGIVLFLRPVGRVAAAVAAACYALFWPAAMVERGTQLEAPQSLLLVTALLLLRPFDAVPPMRPKRKAGVAAVLAGSAGLVLGLDLGIKIWAVVIVAVLLGWLVLQRRFGEFGWLALGVGVGAGALFLPFFFAAPARMWRMVVLDQLGRRWSPNWAARLETISGTSPFARGQLMILVIVAAFLIMAGAAALGWRTRALRPVLAIYAALVGLLIIVPGTFVHYGALLSAPAAILIGSAVARLRRSAARSPVPRLLSGGLAVVVAAVLVALAVPQATLRSYDRMAVGQVSPVLRAPGCVTFDTPSPALSLGLVDRNLNRGCPLMVDLGGLGDQYAIGTGKGRSSSQAWQRAAVRYLRSGSVAILYRIHHGLGASTATLHILHRWPEVARSGAVEFLVPPKHQNPAQQVSATRARDRARDRVQDAAQDRIQDRIQSRDRDRDGTGH
jgi:alpha-1,2-mannosyltransferase